MSAGLPAYDIFQLSCGELMYFLQARTTVVLLLRHACLREAVYDAAVRDNSEAQIDSDIARHYVETVRFRKMNRAKLPSGEHSIALSFLS